MAIVDSYSSLQAAVTDYLARDDLAEFAPNFIQNWEVDFLRDPQNFGRWMEKDLDVSIISQTDGGGGSGGGVWAEGVWAGNSSQSSTTLVAPIPDDYLGLKFAYVNSSPSGELDRMSLKQVIGKYPRGGCTGRPRWITRAGGNFLFGPEPDAKYNIRGWYWAKPVLLRDFEGDAAGHWIIQNAPDLPLYGALLQAQPFLMNDKRIPVWLAAQNMALQSYRSLNLDEETSGSPVQEVLA